MRAGVKDPLFHFGGTSRKAVVMEESLNLERPVFVLHPPEIDIGNVNSPNSFAMQFVTEAITLLTVNVFRDDPVTKGTQALRDSFSNMARSSQAQGGDSEETEHRGE